MDKVIADFNKAIELMPELAREAGLDVGHFMHLFESGQARSAVLAEGRGPGKLSSPWHAHPHAGR